MAKITKMTGIIIFLVWVAIVAYLAFNFDGIVQIMTTGSLMTQLGIYLVSNIAYILIIIGFVMYFKDSAWKSFISSLLVVVSLDVISLPRFALSDSGAVVGASALTNMDKIILDWLVNGMHIAWATAWYLYYLIIPILLVAAAIAFLGWEGFAHHVNGITKPGGK